MIKHLRTTAIILFALASLLCHASGARLFTRCNSHINKMIQDHAGYLWIATDNGLTRFDGSTATTFRRTPDSPSLLNNMVLSIMEDSNHDLWVGSFDGIQKFDRRTESFTTPRLNYPGVPEFTYVNSIIEDSRGNIWFTTSRSGVICFEGEERHPKCFLTTNSAICSDRTTVVFEDKFGNIWIGTNDNGITVYNPVNGTMEHHSHKADDPGTLSGNMIFSIAQINDGRLFVASLDGGIDCYDYRTHRFTRRAIDSPGNAYILKNDPEKNTLYIGTDGSGVMEYDFTEHRLNTIDPDVDGVDLAKAKVHDILKASDGNLWAAIYQKGALMIEASHERGTDFDNYGFNPFRPDHSLGTEAVLSIMRDRSGRVWVGTDGDGVYLGTFGANGRLSFSNIALWPGAAGNVMCLIEDSRGNIYAGCFLDGMGRYDAASRSFRPMRLTGRDGSVLPVVQANTITESPDGKLWVGTNGSGVLVVDPATGVTDILRHESGEAATRTICGNSIHSICFDHNGDIWVGSSDAGLTRIGRTDGKYEHFNLANRRLSSNCVYSIIEDKGGQIWVSTAGGLARISSAGTTTTYNEASGLPSAQIFGVLQGRDKELWLSTVDGLIRFNPESYTLPVTAGSRVRCREFKRGAAFADNTGRLWFGGVGGMVSFDPLTIDNEQLPAPPLSFTTLTYNDNSDGNPAATNAVTVPMGEISEIKLPHDRNSIQVDFSAIEFNRPDEIKYTYRLEGYHDSWQAIPQGLHTITLTDLPPGHYRLTLNADAAEGAPATNCSIPLTIEPPFYLSASAKALYIALLAILIATGTILLHRRLRRRNEMRRLEHEENLAQEKLQFFTDISHEIRTPLTLILSPIAALKKQARDSATLRTYEMMESNGDRILRMIGQIIDLRKFDNGRGSLEVAPVEFRGFIGRICSSFSDIVHRLGIDFAIEVADEVPANVLLDADKIDKVVFNVLTNAFRFTPKGGTVRLSADIDGTGSLRIRISDTGTGIPEEYREAIFERFYQVKGTGKRGGTGIGLHLSRKMMSAHHGSIYVESSSPEGTVFAIVLPLDEAAYTDAERSSGSATVTTTDTHRPSLGEVCPDVPATPAAPQSPKAHTVLIVEDDAAIRSYIAENLRGTYNIAEAADGNEGLEAAIRLRPHCIVTDLMMPGLDGLEMCRKIRDNHDICEIPVVMLTAKATDAQRLEGIEAGADSYITKPFNISYLMTQVAMLIHSRRVMMQKFTGTEPVNAEVAAIKSGDEKLLERVEAAVIKDLANPDLSVEYIAAEIGVSRSHLHRRLKVLTNMSPSAYIKKARMRHAARLLTEKNLAVSEVAYATGFSSLSHFSTVFKEFYGMSPTRYIATKGNVQQ